MCFLAHHAVCVEHHIPRLSRQMQKYFFLLLFFVFHFRKLFSAMVSGSAWIIITHTPFHYASFLHYTQHIPKWNINIQCVIIFSVNSLWCASLQHYFSSSSWRVHIPMFCGQALWCSKRIFQKDSDIWNELPKEAKHKYKYFFSSLVYFILQTYSCSYSFFHSNQPSKKAFFF